MLLDTYVCIVRKNVMLTLNCRMPRKHSKNESRANALKIKNFEFTRHSIFCKRGEPFLNQAWTKTFWMLQASRVLGVQAFAVRGALPKSRLGIFGAIQNHFLEEKRVFQAPKTFK